MNRLDDAGELAVARCWTCGAGYSASPLILTHGDPRPVINMLKHEQERFKNQHFGHNIELLDLGELEKTLREAENPWGAAVEHFAWAMENYKRRVEKEHGT